MEAYEMLGGLLFGLISTTAVVWVLYKITPVRSSSSRNVYMDIAESYKQPKGYTATYTYYDNKQEETIDDK